MKQVILFLIALSAAAQQVDYVKQVSSKPALDPREYNFSLKSGQGVTATLSSPGGNTFTFSHCPLGVNGSNTGHRLYISGGTGTVETFIINGGTCVSGRLSGGTITGTTANAHTGIWSLSSATAGIEEAMWVGGQNSRVTIPAGVFNMHGRVTFPYSLSLRGSGAQATNLIWDASFVTRAIESITPTGGYIDMGDFTMSYSTNGTSQEGIYTQDISDGRISNIILVNPYNGVTGVSVARLIYDNVTMFTRNDGYNFSSNIGSSVTAVSTPSIKGGYITLQVGVGSAIRFGPTIAGVSITGLTTLFGSEGITAAASSGSVNEVIINNCTFDSYSLAGLDMAITGTATSSRWLVSNTLFAGATGNTIGWQIRSLTTAGSITSFTLSSNKLLLDGTPGNAVILAGVTGMNMTGNVINSNQGGDTGILFDSVANSNINITGNNIGSSSSYSLSGAIMANGIYVNTQAHSGVTIVGNTIAASSAAITNLSTVANGVRWANNKGIDDNVPAVASAAALAVPINPFFTITGTTGVTSVTGLTAGKSGAFITTAGAVSFSSGASIGNTITTTQNVPVYYFFDGTKIWLNNPTGGGGGSGTVTSAAFTGDGTVFNATVPGSPITTSGTFAPTLHTQSANTFLRGPTSGGAVAPTFGGIVVGDIGAILTPSQANASNVQGNGTKFQLSTGATTTNDCVKFDANGNTVDAGSACGSGGGSVTSVFGRTGVVVATSGDYSAGQITGLAASATTDTTNAGNISSGTLLVVRGGTGVGTLAANGVLIGEGTSAVVSVATGTSGLCFISSTPGVDPVWASCPGAGGGTAFSALTSGTNTAMAAVLGAGSSLTATGGGANHATDLLASGTISGAETMASVAAPGTPAASNLAVWADSTNNVFSSKNPSGTISNTVIPSTPVSHQFVTGISVSGVVSQAQPAASDVTGLAASATTDTTSASNITSGTLGAARLPAVVVRTDTSSTMGANTYDFTSATSVILPKGAGLAPTASGSVGYDTTANQYRFGFNGTNRTMGALTGSFSNNDCLEYDSATGAIKTAGATCGGGGGTLAGDVTGPSGSNTVSKLQTKNLSVNVPKDSQSITWSAASNAFIPLYESGPIINVLDYGADPTGVLDSTTNFGAAITQMSLSPNSCVYVPGGTYKLASGGVMLGNGTATSQSTYTAPCLIGANRETTILKASANYCPATISITATSKGSPDTITTGSAHGLYVGQLIGIASSTGDTAINGLNWQITAVPSTTTFRIASTASGLAPVNGNGTYTGSGVITNKFPGKCAVLTAMGPHNSARVSDISLDANGFVRDGLDIGHANEGKFERINIRNYTDKGIYATPVSNYWSGAVTPGHAGSNTLYGNCNLSVGDMTVSNVSGSGASGIWIDGLNDPAATAAFDTCSSTFHDIRGVSYSGGAGTYGLMIRASDSMIFDMVYGFSGIGAGAGFEYYFSQPGPSSGFPLNILLRHADTDANGFGGASGVAGDGLPTSLVIPFANEGCSGGAGCFPTGAANVGGVNYQNQWFGATQAGVSSVATWISQVGDAGLAMGGVDPRIGMMSGTRWFSADYRTRWVMGTTAGDYGLPNAGDTWLIVEAQNGHTNGDLYLGATGNRTGITLWPTHFANLGTRPNGTLVYCDDCAILPTCAGTGGGALAKRLLGGWVCN